MPDLRISALPATVTVNNSDVFPLVHGGVTSKVTYANLLADIVANIPPTSGWSLTGNATGNDTSFIGTTDNQTWLFKSNNITYGTLSKTGLWSFGTVAPIAATRVTISGTGTTSATFALQVHNSTGTNNAFTVTDDGNIGIGTLNTTSTITQVYIRNTNSRTNSLGIQTAAGANNLFLSDAMLLTLGNGSTYIGEMVINGQRSGVYNSVASIRTGLYGGTDIPYVHGFSATAANAVIAFLTGTGSTERMRINETGNLGLNTSTFDADGVGVFVIKNGTPPTASLTDAVEIYSTDISAGNASLGLKTEIAVVTETVVSDRTLSVTINGTVYKICLKI